MYNDGTTSLVKIMYGDDYEIRDIVRNDAARKITISMYSTRESVVCPICGTVCTERGGGFTRSIQDVPIEPTYATWVEFHGRKFYCPNDSCKQHSFEEQPDFAKKYSQKTNRCITFLMLIILMLSFFGGAEVCQMIGFAVSHDDLRNMYHNQEILHFEDDPDVEEIGIDDVANHKGMSYFTAIYRYSDHQVLSLLEGRDGTELKDWLLKHPKVRLVCRDRASAYATAIDEVCGEQCIQVADRYHLIDNKIDHVKDWFYQDMPVAVGVKIGEDGTVEVLPRVPSKIVPVTLTLTEEELNALTYDNSVVFDDAGNTIWVDARLSNPDFRQGREQAENRAKKHDLVLEVRKAYAEFDRNTLPRKNASVAAIIAQQFGINVSTVKKYVEMTDAEVEALLEVGQRKERVTGFDEYKNIAYVMLRDGYSIPDIMAYIKKMGCTLADLTIIRHIESVQSHHFPERSVKPFSTLKGTAVYPEGTYVFGRARILKNILTIDEGKKDPELNKCMEAIFSQYPICGTVQASFNAFHSAIMGNDISALDRYIEQYKNVPELSGFVRQLQQDIVPIRNAILLPYSSGWVEGLNCKFKLLKRIFFGRSKRFNLEIRFKCACAFFRDGFELGSVFPWFDAAFPRVA